MFLFAVKLHVSRRRLSVFVRVYCLYECALSFAVKLSGLLEKDVFPLNSAAVPPIFCRWFGREVLPLTSRFTSADVLCPIQVRGESGSVLSGSNCCADLCVEPC